MNNTTTTPIKTVFKTKDNTRLVINANLSKTNYIYFSITADEYEGIKKEPVCGGCMHDTIMEVAPQYADFIALHLSDLDGVPMYAVANGYYYYQNPSTYKIDILANHLRISIDETKDLIKTLNSELENGRRKNLFERFVYMQYARWKQEADDLIKKYNLSIP